MSTMELDPQAILAALGISDARAITPVQGGTDTAIWRVEQGGSTYALRVFRPDQARSAQREVQAMSLLSQAGLPVPQVHAEGSWHDHPALLIGWCAGRTLAAEVLARPWTVWQLGVAAGKAQAQLHAVHVPADLIPSPPHPWIALAGKDEPLLQARLRLLDLRSDALLHLDYHPLNILVDGRNISGIIDWANVSVGDPRADVARTVSILRLFVSASNVPRALMVLGVRILEAAWLQGYRQVAGPLQRMPYFYAWAGAMMINDLTPKLDRGLTASDFERMRRWVAFWKRCAVRS